MLDHLLGRPSVKSRRLQVLAVLTFWTLYIIRQVLQTNAVPYLKFANISIEVIGMALPESDPCLNFPRKP